MISTVRLSDCIGPAFYGLHRDLKDLRHRQYWAKGGRGSLKSSWASLELILGVMADPQASAVVFRRFERYLRDSVYTQLLWAIDTLGVGAYWAARISPMRLTYKPTGQQILFRGADDPMTIKSIKPPAGTYFKYAWFEELTEYRDMDDVRSIIQSVIRGGDAAAVICTYNPPKSAQNWVNAEAMIPRADRIVHHSTYLDAPPQWLGEAFLAEVAALRQSNERAWRHAYLGEITGTGGQVFDNLQIRAISKAERQNMDRIYHGLDFGFAVDPDAYVQMHYNRATRTLYILREYYAARNSFDTLADRVLRLTGPQPVTADAADPRAINEMRMRGVNAHGAKKGPGSVEHGMRWLQQLGAIVIDSATCPNAAREFAGYEYEQDRYGNFRAAYPDRDNHTIDAARYGLESVIGHRKATVGSKAAAGIY